MSCKEQQEEEIEVLQSIYEGDDCFKEVNSTTFQYKVGEDGAHRSFLVEISWGDSYPDQLPDINMNTFYNKHIPEEIKNSVVEKLKEEAENNVGCAMTYTLFEWAKENMEELMADQPESAPVNPAVEKEKSNENQTDQPSQKKEKKEQLTKAQKRRLYDRLDNKGERPRGHDWVDVVKHLSQIGNRDEQGKVPTN